jgi:hypothetical protein
VYGRWLRGHSAVFADELTAFLHGGIAPSFAGSTLSDVDRRVHEDLASYDADRQRFVADGVILAFTDLQETLQALREELAALPPADANADKEPRKVTGVPRLGTDHDPTELLVPRVCRVERAGRCGAGAASAFGLTRPSRPAPRTARALPSAEALPFDRDEHRVFKGGRGSALRPGDAVARSIPSAERCDLARAGGVPRRAARPDWARLPWDPAGRPPPSLTTGALDFPERGQGDQGRGHRRGHHAARRLS